MRLRPAEDVLARFANAAVSNPEHRLNDFWGEPATRGAHSSVYGCRTLCDGLCLTTATGCREVQRVWRRADAGARRNGLDSMRARVEPS